MNDIQIFNYNGADVRTVEMDGDILFVGKDVANILGYKRTRDALRKHVDAEDKRARQIDAPSNGGYIDVTVINEAGVYSLIFSSKLPIAKQFKHWVTHEVLPQIRKNGMYLSDKAMEAFKNDPEAFDLLMKKYIAEETENRKLKKQIADDSAYTTLGKVVLALPGSMTVQEAAHMLAQKGIPIGQNRLYKRCRDENLLCKRKGKQYNQPTQKAIDKGLFNAQISNVGFKPIAMVTPQGLQFLSNLFPAENFPLVYLMETQGDEQQDFTSEEKEE